MNNELQAIKKETVLGKEFTVYGDAFDPLFLAKDVADMIGHSDVSKMVKAVDDDEKVKNIILTPGGAQETWLLTEDGLYEILMQSRKPIAKAFKKEVKAILKELRTKGCVITTNAKDEAIDFNRVFGKYRLRKSIREAQDIRQLFEDYIRLSAIERTAGRLSNKERIYALNAFTDEIQILIANEATSMRGSELLALQELLTDVSKEKTRLSNKANGGFKSNMTRKIKQLEDEIAVTQEDIDFYDGSFYCINRHSYTANRLTDVKDGRKVKAAGYKIWLSKLNLPDFLPETMTDVDFTKKLRLTLGFISVQTMDLDNQIKAIQDALAEYYDFDDIQIDDLRAKRIDTVDSYEEGKIYVKIENMF